MIGRISGTVLSIDGSHAIVDVAGVGYEVLCSRDAIAEMNEGSPITLCIHTDVKEDSITLCGFLHPHERSTFRLLLKVNGVGTKTALEVLSHISAKDLLRSIAAGDVAALQKIKGVGRKTAERVVLELRERVIELVPEPSGREGAFSVSNDAVAALVSLGITKRDAERAVQEAHGKGASLETTDIIREALRYI